MQQINGDAQARAHAQYVLSLVMVLEIVMRTLLCQ